eukprot:TRINITY_DN14349_c0_g1_i1.p1 TRINITY_DN14349_c0_g1~~TRINITY_DN14349_c0_g1_i1.p1  ORF type:complete len:338 (-),score=97.14 TRINITY_DN14349_c0_g1_i1:267-1280(-)
MCIRDSPRTEETPWSDAACNWRDVGQSNGMPHCMFYRSSEAYPETRLAMLKTIVDLRRPKDRVGEEEQRISDEQYRRCTFQFVPEHITRLQINFVPTHPTGLAIFRAIPTSDALSNIAPWNDTELAMQMSIRDHLGFGGLYCIILQHSGPQILEALRVFCDEASYPILVHCIHGKDRTGLLVALVSLIAGVPEEHVVTDFQLSEDELLAAKAAGLPKIAHYLDWQLLAPRAAMEQTIQYLKDQTAKTSANHAARAYAISIGLSHTELKSLCKVLRVNGAEVLQESKPAAAAQAEGEEPRVTLSTPELLMKCDPEIDCAECEECHPDPNLLRAASMYM